MHRAILYVAFIALCSAAPYNNYNSQRAFTTRQEPLQQYGQNSVPVTTIQQDDTQLVDTLGGGYSFFKKQEIGSRPVIQQKLAVSDRQGPLTSFDDTANQWSDYTRSSALKPLIRTLGNSYGQQQVQPIVQDQPLVRAVGNSYGQQQDVVPLIRTIDNSYGQQQVQPILQDQPLVRAVGNSYGQQQVQTVVQDQPLVRAVDNSYGQQQDAVPLIRTVGNSYGQQQDFQPAPR
ncbi:unnamed protein product, partial [Adineta steineri]